MIRRILAAAAVLLLTGCSADLLVTDPGGEIIPGLQASISVAPGEVQAHDAFTARLTLTNVTSSEVSVVTNGGCLALPVVTRDGERVPFQGSSQGCTGAITTHTFAPGETRVITWNLRAELYGQQSGDLELAPAPRGTYRVRAEIQTEARPSVDQVLRVI